MAISIYQDLNACSLNNSDNEITANSEKITGQNQFVFNVTTYDLGVDFTLLNNNKIYFQREYPNPQAFLINSPNLYFQMVESFDINDFNYHNASAYKRGCILVQEYYNNTTYEYDTTTSFIILNGEENYEKDEFNYVNYQLDSTGSSFLTDYDDDRTITLNSYQFASILNGSNYPGITGFTLVDGVNSYPIFNAVPLNCANDYFIFDINYKLGEDRIGYGSNYTKLKVVVANDYVNDYGKSRLDINLNADIVNALTGKTIYSVYNGIWNEIDSGFTGDILDSNLKSFDFYTSSDSSGVTITSKKYNYKLRQKDIYLLDDYNLVWINRFGGLESFILKGKINKTYKVNKNVYSRSNYNIGTDGKLDRSFYDQDKYTNNKTVEDSYTLTTDWIDTVRVELLLDMIKSNNVFYIKDGVKIPVIIFDETISIKNDNLQGLSNYTFDMTYNIRKKYKSF